MHQNNKLQPKTILIIMLHELLGEQKLVKEQDKTIIQPIGEDLEELFKKAKHIKPKHNLTAEQMDELIENEIHGDFDNLDIPREEP